LDDEFAPKGQAMTDTTAANPVHDFIAKAVTDHSVVLFMKGVPEQPQCGFSAQVVQILDHLGADFVGVNVLQSEPLRDGIKTFSDWPTIPQLYVAGEFVGGCDIVREMFQSGELKTLLDEKGLLAA
jgi:monothiol glutaredoxin